MFVEAVGPAACFQFCCLFNALMKEARGALFLYTFLYVFIILLYLHRKNNVPERLEVDPSKRTAVDLANIVPRQIAKEGPMEASRPPPAAEDHFSEGFVDDPDVPPLI